MKLTWLDISVLLCLVNFVVSILEPLSFLFSWVLCNIFNGTKANETYAFLCFNCHTRMGCLFLNALYFTVIMRNFDQQYSLLYRHKNDQQFCDRHPFQNDFFLPDSREGIDSVPHSSVLCCEWKTITEVKQIFKASEVTKSVMTASKDPQQCSHHVSLCKKIYFYVQ